MPMVGRPIIVDGVQVGWACSREKAKYCKCGRRAELLCDFALKGRKAGQVCSALLCARCTTVVDGKHHFCPAHAKLAKGAA